MDRRTHRWGVILAGGDGQRFLPLTRKITGDDRPKQFCALTGGETLLDQTRRRAARLIPTRQTLLLLMRKHERYYRDQVADVPAACQLIQPFNHGTAPAIAYSLTRLMQMDPSGIVAFFPSDHHFTNDDAFVEHIELAFVEADAQRGRVILLGIEPDAPEEAYGWIEPGKSLSPRTTDLRPVRSLTGGPAGIFDVNRFWEKPSRAVAKRLFRNGCLWNSFVMIGAVEAFIEMIQRTIPELIASFENMCATTTSGTEVDALRNVYDKVPASNFSHNVLAASPSALTVMRARGLGWSDLGEPQRVLSALGSREGAPGWENGWTDAGLAASA
jgi:mannose-1-phosphate guanylyltransferase